MKTSWSEVIGAACCSSQANNPNLAPRCKIQLHQRKPPYFEDETSAQNQQHVYVAVQTKRYAGLPGLTQIMLFVLLAVDFHTVLTAL